MQMILNELSADFPVFSREEGKKIMTGFLKVYQEVRKRIMNDSLILDKDYNTFYLAKDYHISEWRKDPTVDREEQRLFRSILNKAVVYDESEIDDVKIDVSNSELKCQGKNAVGCLIAYETDNFVLSFGTHVCWQSKIIKGMYSTLYELETLDEPIEVEVRNISKVEDVSQIEADCIEQMNERYRSVKNGRELLQHREEWFPAIQFCENAIEQLKNENTLMNIQQIIKKLSELNAYFSSLEGNFDMHALKNCSPETDVTLKHYKVEHTFLTPEGKAELFSFHLRFTGTYAGRIFFKQAPEERRCIVAHIGKKLKNQKYH